MANKKKNILTDATQAVVMAIGRERNAIEFYNYLAETAPVDKAKEFFNEMVQRESGDMKDLETFLEKLKREDKGDKVK
ncbi:MAG: hypothetical protein ACUZ8E_02505 [Candidatus Anammoxibacter sp.]